MRERYDVPVAPLTTLRLGGPAARLVEAGSDAEIIEAVRWADGDGVPVLLVGGGSNLVLADDGWPGLVVLLRSRGVTVRRGDGGGTGDGGTGDGSAGSGERVTVTVQAGEPWDDVVRRAVAEGWAGIECLAGIPGLAGATPVQNVGAYGQEVAETITGVTAWDRSRGEVRELSTVECEFAYRTSRFKHTDRYVVLAVELSLAVGELSGPVRYAELARALGVEVGARAKLAEVRDAVLTLRRGKGMVLDPADHDTWSAGSFFTNPVLSTVDTAAFEARLAPGTAYPHWPAGDGLTKLSAAWLIEHAGLGKGYRRGPVGLSGKHTLALTNRGGASTRDLLALAREVRASVHDRYGVLLQPEPLLAGVTL
ncbi:MAG TPA: UDP-N-acetylmuramate dehydrogenase [Mycobacteriales bacterium]|nr:UDP-N-acetylmuramate dehydrogenase [Mycobacteriales bacterium]